MPNQTLDNTLINWSNLGPITAEYLPSWPDVQALQEAGLLYTRMSLKGHWIIGLTDAGRERLDALQQATKPAAVAQPVTLPTLTPEQIRKLKLEFEAEQYLLEVEEKRAAADALRADPALRVEVVRLIKRLQEGLLEAAERVTVKRTGAPDRFKDDAAADGLVFLLAEFLTGVQIDVTADVTHLKGYQVSERHALDWFNVDLYVPAEPSGGLDYTALGSDAAQQ